MDCSKIEKLISDFADGELSGAGEKEIRTHLEKCSKCSKLYHLETLTKKAVKSIPTEKAPAGLKDRILAAISSEEETPAKTAEVIKPPSWFWGVISRRPAAIASGAAAVLLVGVFLSVAIIFHGIGMSPFIESVYASHNGDGSNLMYHGTPSEIEKAVREALQRDNIHVASLSAANMQLQGATGDLKIRGKHCVAVKYNGSRGDFSHFVICCMKVPIDRLPEVEGNPGFHYHEEGGLTMVFWRCNKTRTTRVLASECGIDQLMAVAKQLRMEEL